MREIASHVLPKGAEVILFGSRARGDARVDSDWDILILIDGERATCEDFEKFAYPSWITVGQLESRLIR